MSSTSVAYTILELYLHREDVRLPSRFNGKRRCLKGGYSSIAFTSSALFSSEDCSAVPKLPHSIPKGEYLSQVFSTIVILKKRSERQDSMKKCMMSQLARSNIEDISSFSLKGGTNLSALSRSNPKSIRSLLDPIELTYKCIQRERSIHPWQR
jgi:hypothetical protein